MHCGKCAIEFVALLVTYITLGLFKNIEFIFSQVNMCFVNATISILCSL